MPASPASGVPAEPGSPAPALTVPKPALPPEFSVVGLVPAVAPEAPALDFDPSETLPEQPIARSTPATDHSRRSAEVKLSNPRAWRPPKRICRLSRRVAR